MQSWGLFLLEDGLALLLKWREGRKVSAREGSFHVWIPGRWRSCHLIASTVSMTWGSRSLVEKKEQLEVGQGEEG